MDSLAISQFAFKRLSSTNILTLISLMEITSINLILIGDSGTCETIKYTHTCLIITW